MCEIFKCINLLVDELQKDGLQIPVNISSGKPILSDARAYLPSSNFNSRVRYIF